MATKVKIHNGVKLLDKSGKYLCFQRVTYHSNEKPSRKGFRFIWERNGKLLPSRGQARIPNARMLKSLLQKAKSEGWFK